MKTYQPTASTAPEDTFLAHVWAVHTLGVRDDLVRVYQTAMPQSEGEPFNKPDSVLVNFHRGYQSLTFDTGINALRITKLSTSEAPDRDSIYIDVIEAGKPKMLEFGVADETAWRVGLSCGGRIKVYVEKLD